MANLDCGGSALKDSSAPWCSPDDSSIATRHGMEMMLLYLRTAKRKRATSAPGLHALKRKPPTPVRIGTELTAWGSSSWT